jgi:HTH-type transcriptional regulator/antitoxin HigA
MNSRSLKTEQDYQEALAEIERLFEAAPETSEGDRLDILTPLVEAYEEQHHPILPPDPVAALEYYMESRGLSRRD